MDYIPARLFKGIRVARDADPGPANSVYSSFHYIPSKTASAHVEKITHALGKLGQAGVIDDVNNGNALSTSRTGTATTTHAEKITHVTSKLGQAGLAGAGSPSSSSSHHGLATKYIIIIAVVGAVLLMGLVTGACICMRRYRRRRAYAVVSRGLDNKGKEKLHEKEDVFNADMHDPHDTETDRLNLDSSRIGERNFENGYDNVETGYESTSYGGAEENHGDKRAKFEA